MRKRVRNIVVDGCTFRWVLPGNTLYQSKLVAIVVFGTQRGRMLQIDPYAWALEIRPKVIAEAIRFALARGWQPEIPGPALRLGFREDGFFVIGE